jgi:hypothetical protein
MLDSLIDPDDQRTWPPLVLAWAEARAASLAGSTEFTNDLNSRLIEREDEFRALFVGTKVLVYHCTRLLEWEAEDIRSGGLAPLTRGLVVRRIDQADARDALGREEAERLRTSDVFTLRNACGREGQVCFVLGREGFEDSGVQDFFSLWGGEGIYWAHADDADAPRLGRPAIVAAGIDVSDPRRALRFGPALSKVFVAPLLGTRDNYADVFLEASVPASDTMAIWQPGDPEYDRFTRSPKS